MSTFTWENADDIVVVVQGDYSPDQPREPDGKFGIGGFLKSVFGGAHPNLSSEEKSAVKSYTSDGYKDLNKGLRSGSLSAEQQTKVDSINRALDKMPPHNGEVFRTARLTGKQFSDYMDARGKTISELGFTSTSQGGFRDITTHSNDPGQLFGFRINSNGVGRDVSALSKSKEEREVLFKAGTNFRITKIVGREIQMEAVASKGTKDYSPDQPREPDGKFGSGGGASAAGEKTSSGKAGLLTSAKEFIKGDAARNAIKAVADKIAANKHELIGTAVIAGVALMKANLPPDVSDALYEIAAELSRNANVEIAVARDTMRRAVDKLITLRRGAKDTMTDAEDELLARLLKLRDLLDDDDIFNDYDPDQPRGPDGKFESTGGSSANKDKPHLANVKGSVFERENLRKELKTTFDPQKQQEIKEKIVHSFYKEQAKFKAEGNKDKVTALQYKIDNIEKKYGFSGKADFEKKSGGGGKVAEPQQQTVPGTNIPIISYEKKLGSEKPLPMTPKAAAAIAAVQSALQAPVTGLGKSAESSKFGGHEIKSEPEKEQKLTKQEKELNQKEKSAIFKYTGHEYRELNAGLRNGALDEKQWNQVSSINSGLDKLPNHEGIVRRQAELPPAVYEKFKEGVIVEERAFTSTSKNPNWSWDSNGTNFYITSKTGKSIEHLSDHPNEQEVLFRSGTRFRVTKRVGKDVHMEEVGSRTTGDAIVLNTGDW